ncbi:MAG: hypothetical protein ACTSUP_01175 [Candidatus Heimdallarchaeaceae archaeon]
MNRPKTFNDFQEYAQLLLASKIFHEFIEIRVVLAATRELEAMGDHKRGVSDFPEEDIEPESFVENWIKENIIGGTKEWREGVSKYFIKLFVNYPNSLRGEAEEE